MIFPHDLGVSNHISKKIFLESESRTLNKNLHATDFTGIKKNNRRYEPDFFHEHILSELKELKLWKAVYQSFGQSFFELSKMN